MKVVTELGEEETLSITAISEGGAKQEAFYLVYDRRIGLKGATCERTEVEEIMDEE